MLKLSEKGSTTQWLAWQPGRALNFFFLAWRKASKEKGKGYAIRTSLLSVFFLLLNVTELLYLYILRTVIK